MRQKIQTCLLIIALMGLLVVGTSTAFFTDEVKTDIARFVSGTVKIDFDGPPRVEPNSIMVDKQGVTWFIKNNSTDDVYIRVKVLHYLDLEELNIDGHIDLDVSDTDWLEGEDGYYYYRNPVKRGDTLDFSLEVTFDVFETIESYPMDIEVEAIQASNDAINHEWENNPL